MSEQSEFLKDIQGNQEDPFSYLNKNEESVDVEPAKEDDIEEVGRWKGNRETRREAQKAQKYKEEAIALNARLQALSENREAVKDIPEADYLSKVERIYGNATPEAREATELLKEALRGVHNSAKAEALEEAVGRIDADRNGESEAVKEAENEVDEGLESLEDEYDADFSDSATRNGFLTLLEKVSPKDRDGNIKEYADFGATYELYQSRQNKSADKAKELTSRSMTRGGNSGGSELQSTAIDNYAKEQGWA
jgi:hypothetical protein